VDSELLRIGVDGVVPVRWDVAKAGDDPGTLTGWASVYNTIDRQEDVVIPGAFKKTLAEWRTSKRVIPLTLDHKKNAEGVIGSLVKAEDTPLGLRTTFRFASTPDAQTARVKAREGHLTGLSVEGGAVNPTVQVVDGRPVRLLKEIALMSVGLSPFPANTGALVTVAKASDKPWSQFTQADYTPQQWRRACLIDTGVGDTDSKARYSLPVREPSGVLNRNGVHAAAARLNQVSVSADKRAAAARALIRLYGELGEDPPESLRRMAGTAKGLDMAELPELWVADMRAALSLNAATVRKTAVDALVADLYGPTPDVDDSGGETDPPADADSTNVDDAALYALSIIGESGPDTSPPGGKPSDSLADLLAPLETAGTTTELDALEAELKQMGQENV
jgi:HK97 family phage prohead protease